MVPTAAQKSFRAFHVLADGRGIESKRWDHVPLCQGGIDFVSDVHLPARIVHSNSNDDNDNGDDDVLYYDHHVVVCSFVNFKIFKLRYR